MKVHRKPLITLLLLASTLVLSRPLHAQNEGVAQQNIPLGPFKLQPASDLTACMDVSGANKADGAVVQSYSCNGTSAQSWVVVPMDSANGSTYQIVSGNSGSCLTGVSGGGANQLIQQDRCVDGGQISQEWQIFPFNTAYEFVSVSTGQCVALSAGGSANGLQLQENKCGEGSERDELWNLVAAPSQGIPVTAMTSGPFTINPSSNLNACMDVSGGRMDNGTSIQSYSCNGTDAQVWTLLPVSSARGNGYELVSGSSNACLDIQGESFANGARANVWQCAASSLPAQIWQLYMFGASYELVSLESGMCLDLPNGNSNNGNQLQQWSCGNGTNTNQLWKFTKLAGEGTPAAAVSAGPFEIQPISNASACTDVAGGNQANGTSIQAWACNSTSSQSWSLVPIATSQGTGYQVISGNSKACLDIPNSTSGNGATVQEWQCLGAAQLTQAWQIYPFGSSFELVSLKTGKCLDLPSGQSSNGVQLQQWACGQGNNSNQLWKFTKPQTANITPAVPQATSTSVLATPLAPVTGQTVIISTQVTGTSSLLVGTVNVYDGAMLVGNAVLDSTAAAKIAIPHLANGAHSISVTYSGSGLNLASSSVPVMVTVAEPSVGEQALQADAFVDSVGVQTHLSYDNTPYYSAWPAVFKELKSSGIRHIRDGWGNYAPTVPFLAEFRALSAAGIKGTFGFPLDYSITTQMVQTFATNSQDVEALEAPNECDAGGNCGGGGLTGTNNVIAFLPQLAAAGKALNVPVLGPSFTNPQTYQITGNISTSIAYNNLHVYFGGRNPGSEGWGGGNAQNHRYGSLAFWLDQASDNAPNVPVQITETGYIATPTTSTPYTVPESVQASYIPRTLLLAFNQGVKRTFLYELLDEVSSPGYGLLRSDVSEKPAFVAVKTLMSLLNDQGNSFAPGKLAYTLSGGDSTISHTLLQKRDGSFWLVLWSEQSSYDPSINVATPVKAQNVTLSLTGPAFATQMNQFDATGSSTLSQLATPTQNLVISINDQLTMVQITPQ